MGLRFVDGLAIFDLIPKIWPKKDRVSQTLVVMMGFALAIAATAYPLNNERLSALAMILIFVLAIFLLWRLFALESRRLEMVRPKEDE